MVQLFFTTHESHLLDLEMFRQDEIWFVEKNKTGNTKIYPLSDYKLSCQFCYLMLGIVK